MRRLLLGLSDNDEEVEPADDDKGFMKLLSEEIEKVTRFYTTKASIQ